MNLKTIKYFDYEKNLPQKGNHILAQRRNDNLIVYQAFNPRITAYAVKNQRFGGAHYNYGRMSWIKPNFLWMMYRCGWAGKENQKRVLAIELAKSNFKKILQAGVHSSYQPTLYKEKLDWQADLQQSEVRIQWDPDHDPKGAKLDRRAIQLGLRGDMLQQFGNAWIVSIEDITDFVLEQGKKVKTGKLDQLEVIQETVISISEIELRRKLLLQ